MGQAKKNRLKISRTMTIVLGFATIILLGTLLLLLPFATRQGEQTGILGALFTTVSATCVTGLVVYDTWTHWTLFGQLVLLSLIQIGGLGFITIGVFAMTMLQKRVGLAGRELIHDSLSTLQIRGSVQLVRRIILGTLLFEGAGAALLALRFVPQMGLGTGLYYAVFHAISAFCNAGFDLMGYQESFSSFCAYTADPLVIVVLSALILIGGIGFIVWEDLLEHRLHWRRYQFQTKVVLTATLGLTLGGMVLYLLAERENLFAGMSLAEQLLAALFCAVTPRTAGFNSVDIAAMSNGGLLTTMALMFIGGSPGSTAGGIKTTTVVVMLLYIKSYIFQENDCVAFGRRLDDGAIKRACAVIFVNFSLALVGCLVILIGQNLPLPDVLFEVFSAIGTAGISTGVTRELNALSQVVIALLMFCGRVGSLTFAMSFAQRKRIGKLRYPQEELIVG